MASSIHFLSLNMQTLSHNHSFSCGTPQSVPVLTLKPPSKLSLSFSSSFCGVISCSCPPFASKFSGKVAFSSDLDELEGGFSGSEEANFSPDVKLFVGNLPFSVDSAALAGVFEQAGNVEMVEVIYDKLSGRSRGFGFVTMSSVQEAEAAVQQFNGYELQGRAIRVNSGPPPAKREDNSPRGGFRGRTSSDDGFRGRTSSDDGFRGRTSSDDGNRVYVGNLAWGVDDLALETLFSEQGKVKEAKVVYDRDSGRSRGFGFVTYNSPDEVNNAIESLDGTDLNGRSIRVSPAEARPRRQF